MPAIVRALATNMFSMGEPNHRRLRDIVDEAFRRRAVLEIEPRIHARADTVSAPQLARIEGRCALRSLFQRWPKLGLAAEDRQIR